ncbi:DUF7344 domain-containing protein [Haladaptatus cibarius]|uniref:DUF7344 domain-containing protein n=1 Tax=Haladaptatus cibarius TaxID=453847 RepID=UPI0006784D26|nr:hypothetical protein [Haladaptatus cibarius]
MAKDDWDVLYDILLEPSIDDSVYRALSDTQRRYTLYLLVEWGRVFEDELADILTGWIHADEYRMATPDDRERIHIELHEIHIPILREAGLVRYDEQMELLSLGEVSPPVGRILDWARQNERQNTPEPNSES